MRAAQNAVLVTTPKDAVRVPSSLRPRIHVIGVSLAWEEPAALEQLLSRFL
jgi:tetraacyldisaccharide 4'-kinase